MTDTHVRFDVGMASSVWWLCEVKKFRRDSKWPSLRRCAFAVVALGAFLFYMGVKARSFTACRQFIGLLFIRDDDAIGGRKKINSVPDEEIPSVTLQIYFVLWEKIFPKSLTCERQYHGLGLAFGRVG
jgi:hypothetical protein